MKEILNSSTRLILIIMVLSLIGMCYLTLFYSTADLFEKVFAVFTQVITGIVGYFIAKSTQDGKENTMTTTVSKEIKPTTDIQS